MSYIYIYILHIVVAFGNFLCVKYYIEIRYIYKCIAYTPPLHSDSVFSWHFRLSKSRKE